MNLEELLEKNNEQLRDLVNGYEKEIELLKTLLCKQSRELDEVLMIKEKRNKVLDAIRLKADDYYKKVREDDAEHDQIVAYLKELDRMFGR